MDSSDYIYILNKPNAINEQHGLFLYNIITEFPYFQSARALRLKKLYNQNSFTYNQELKKTAAFTTDRAVLFELITSKDFTAVQKGFIDTKDKQLDNINVIENKDNITYLPYVPNTNVTETIAPTVAKTEEVEKPQEIVAIQGTEAESNIEEATITTIAAYKDKDENAGIPETIVTEPIPSNIDSETQKIPQPIAFLSDLTEPRKYEDLFVPKTQVTEELIPASTIKAEEKPIEPEPTPLLEDNSLTGANVYDIVFVPKTATEEATIIKQEATDAVDTAAAEEFPRKEDEFSKEDDNKIVAITEKLQIGEPLHFSKEEKHSFQEWLQLSSFTMIDRSKEKEKQDQEREAELEKQKKLALIDKFIETNPKISPVKNNITVLKVNEEQPEDHAMLMTETLAKVYLEQKKYQKAIQAYEILILKYPEKISFFADRISDIKILQQNNT